MYHLHYEDNQTWDHSRLKSRDSIVILGDDNGNEIERNVGYCEAAKGNDQNGRTDGEAGGTAASRGSLARPSGQPRRSSRKRESSAPESHESSGNISTKVEANQMENETNEAE